jgi:hypothetical protein
MRTRLRAVCGALVVSASLILMVGGTASGAASTGVDLSTATAIKSYLQSIGVDPASVTWQGGLKNYAGPSCPGVGWTCTRSTKVVQIAKAGGQNTTECSGKPAATTTVNQGDQSCVVMQSAPANGENHATCREKSSEPVVIQQCTIVQDNAGGGNHADVNQENVTS